MPQIGKFTRAKDDTFAGTIRTLTLNAKIDSKVVERESDKSPNHKFYSNGIEIGAGWEKSARDTGTIYVSCKFDDPSLPAPIYASLVQDADGETWKLIWSR